MQHFDCLGPVLATAHYARNQVNKHSIACALSTSCGPMQTKNTLPSKSARGRATGCSQQQRQQHQPTGEPSTCPVLQDGCGHLVGKAKSPLLTTGLLGDEACLVPALEHCDDRSVHQRRQLGVAAQVSGKRMKSPSSEGKGPYIQSLRQRLRHLQPQLQPSYSCAVPLLLAPRWWITAPVSAGILVWWWLFLVLVPQSYSSYASQQIDVDPDA